MPLTIGLQAARLSQNKNFKTATKIADYTVANTDDIVNISGASAAVDVTLPDETMCVGQYLYIKVLNVANAVSIKASDGSTDVIASASVATYWLHCDGTNWTEVLSSSLESGTTASKIADYTVLPTDKIVNVSGASATVDLTMPDESSSLGKIIVVNVTDITNAVSIKASDGSTDVVIATIVRSYLLYCDGSNWVEVNVASVRNLVTASKTADYVVLENDGIVNISGASAAVDVTLPDELSSLNQKIYVRVSDVTNTVAIKASDGTTDILASAAVKSYLFHCNGSSWTKVLTADL